MADDFALQLCAEDATGGLLPATVEPVVVQMDCSLDEPLATADAEPHEQDTDDMHGVESPLVSPSASSPVALELPKLVPVALPQSGDVEAVSPETFGLDQALASALVTGYSIAGLPFAAGVDLGEPDDDDDDDDVAAEAAAEVVAAAGGSDQGSETVTIDCLAVSPSAAKSARKRRGPATRWTRKSSRGSSVAANSPLPTEALQQAASEDELVVDVVAPPTGTSRGAAVEAKKGTVLPETDAAPAVMTRRRGKTATDESESAPIAAAAAGSESAVASERASSPPAKRAKILVGTLVSSVTPDTTSSVTPDTTSSDTKFPLANPQQQHATALAEIAMPALLTVVSVSHLPESINPLLPGSLGPLTNMPGMQAPHGVLPDDAKPAKVRNPWQKP
jgi:hypothetical protein